MPLSRFASRWSRLATWLSFLALWSALVAPASVLAQEVRTGKWGGLCTAGLSSPSGQDSHAPEGNGHCDMCVLPGLGLPPASHHALAVKAASHVPLASQPGHRPGPQAERPHIRGPPAML